MPPYKTPPFSPIMHLYSRLCQTHISLLQTFVHRFNPLSLRSPSRSVPNTLATIHSLNQPTIIHPFHMTKPSQHTFIYSLIYPFLHTTHLSNTFIPHFINSSHTCLLYTSDAADERSSVDLGGRRIIKK